MNEHSTWDVGVDIGGTFTDVVCRALDGRLHLAKIPTTRADPSRGVLHAIEHMRRAWNIEPRQIARFVHGTTVATNAVLERKGAKIGLITTQGFKDTLELGRQSRRAVYSVMLKPETPGFLAPGALRREVPERMAASGAVLVPLDEEAVRQAGRSLLAADVHAIAVVFLFSYLNPAHELRARELLLALRPDLMISLSCEVDPAFREYERTCITAFDAYLKPVIDRYLERMERDLAAHAVPAPLQIMQSRGGVACAQVARRRPVRLFLSGPAAGVIGASRVGREAGALDIISIDIGGTSADIALVHGGRPIIASEGTLDGYAVRVPMVDVNAIGAGGGSIAWLDAGGSLRVGPHSAGAEPGPACYARGGGQPTVTDASVVLGYIDPAYFAGGAVRLDPARARAAIERSIAQPLGMSVEQAALGIHRVVNANMAEGIRLVSVKRGIDPRGFALVPLGGAGPVHATALARDLGIRSIVVPRHPGVLSADGLLCAPVEHEAAKAYHRRLDEVDAPALAAQFEELDARCAALMAIEGVASAAVAVHYFADLCYVGQSYHLEVPVVLAAGVPQAIERDFYALHDRIYGHSTPGRVQFVNLRAVHQAAARELPAGFEAAAGQGAASKGVRAILTEATGGFVAARIHEREHLQPGSAIEGPAVIEQMDTTTVVDPGWRAQVHASGHIVMTWGETP
ncbi:MAG: hydantoinase/oxoprolinase family protein [Burkholderiales bacterium]|nr:hydantoinase/oxoprolinase family protein [Burkholderiales bacterium]